MKLIINPKTETIETDGDITVCGINLLETLFADQKYIELFNEVILENVLENIPPENFGKYVALLRNMIKSSGSVSLCFVDIRDSAWKFLNGNMSLDEFHMTIFGQNREKCVILDTTRMVDLVQQVGFIIETISASNNNVRMVLRKQ